MKDHILVYPYLYVSEDAENRFEEYRTYLSTEYNDLVFNPGQCRYSVEACRVNHNLVVLRSLDNIEDKYMVYEIPSLTSSNLKYGFTFR